MTSKVIGTSRNAGNCVTLTDTWTSTNSWQDKVSKNLAACLDELEVEKMENAVVIKTPPENSGTNNGQFRRGNPFRFPPGRSGNPGGRPRRRISEALADDLEKTIPSTPEIIALCRDLRLSRRSTWAQLVARVLLNRSLNELDAAREVCDRVEGKARTPIELGGSEKRDIHIHVTHEDSPTRE